MENPNLELPFLSEEQQATLSDSQKQIFAQLGEADQLFFAHNFSAQSLGRALERKWQTHQSQARLRSFDEKVKANLQNKGSVSSTPPGLNATDLAVGAAGVAGMVGIGALASQIAPDGKAAWRGVNPRDLVDPLVATFARQAKTDLKFIPPTDQGVIQATVLIQTAEGFLPGLQINLTPLSDSTEVEISKVSSESLIGMLKEGGQKLFDLIQDGLRLHKQKAGAESVFDLAGKAVDGGLDIAKMVKDLDLEDKAWETIQRTADPLQKIYDEKKAIEKAHLAQIEALWDQYQHCPKCGVPFGAEDLDCRVCGTARPAKPDEPDPRKVI